MALYTSSHSFLGALEPWNGGRKVGWWWASWYRVTWQLDLRGNVAFLSPLYSPFPNIFFQLNSYTAGLNHNMNRSLSSGLGFPFSIRSGKKPLMKLASFKICWAWIWNFPKTEREVFIVMVMVELNECAHRTRNVWFQTRSCSWLVCATFWLSILMVT